MQQTTTVNVSDSPTPPPPPPPPPTNNRRPRTREVSSRFMTPSASTAQRRQQRDDSDDENSESSFPIGYSFQKKQQQQRVVKLFKESTNNRVFENPPNPNPNPNSNPNSHHPPKSSSFSRSGINSTPCASRPDTPTPTISVSSRYRHTPQHRSINSRSLAASKSIQSRGNSNSSHSHDDIGINCSTQSLPELCSENDKNVLMKESNVLTGSVAEKIGNNLSRSVSLSSGVDHLLVRGSEKQHGSVIKQSGFGNQSLDRGKMGGLHLPPVAPPQFAKSVVDTRKGKKGSSQQEDVHSLRLFYNRYLQWRFANARAACAMKAQQKECEKALFSRAMKISEMRNSVNRKRIELELLRRSKTLSIVLESQIPYLDEWSAMEEDYSVSITEAIQALLNASMRLPTGGNVRVDVREVGESLNSALKVMETIVSNTQRLMPKAEETDTSISELARVVGGERALIEECGGLLSKTHKSQVEECSLRAQLIQLNSICHKNKEITSNS